MIHPQEGPLYAGCDGGCDQCEIWMWCHIWYLPQTPQNHSGEKMSNMISGLRCHMDGGLPPLSSIKYLSTFVKMTRRPQMGDMSDCLFPGFQVRPKNSVSSSLRTRTCTRHFFMFTEQTSLELSPKYQLYLLLKVMDYLPIIISWGNYSSLGNTSREKKCINSIKMQHPSQTCYWWKWKVSILWHGKDKGCLRTVLATCVSCPHLLQAPSWPASLLPCIPHSDYEHTRAAKSTRPDKTKTKN